MTAAPSPFSAASAFLAHPPGHRLQALPPLCAAMARYARHWPVFAAMGLACCVLTELLAEVLAQPEASAVLLVLLTGAFTDVLAAPASATRHLQFWMVLADNAASWLWSFALIGVFLRHLPQPRHGLRIWPTARNGCTWRTCR